VTDDNKSGPRRCHVRPQAQERLVLSNATITLYRRRAPMSVNLRWEQCCETQGCNRPARHGSLCTSCYLIATPGRRAAERLGAAPDAAGIARRDLVDASGVRWLEDLWAA
jgi:hypothetical protein